MPTKTRDIQRVGNRFAKTGKDWKSQADAAERSHAFAQAGQKVRGPKSEVSQIEAREFAVVRREIVYGGRVQKG